MKAEELAKDIFHMTADTILLDGSYAELSIEIKTKTVEIIEAYAKEYAKACLQQAAERVIPMLDATVMSEDSICLLKDYITSEENLI